MTTSLERSPSQDEHPIRSLVVAIDVSAQSSAALAFAADVARHLGCAVDILSVRETHSRADMMVDRLERVLRADDEAVLDEARNTVADIAGPECDITTHAETGRAGQLIPAFAERAGADLIVLGSRHNAAPSHTTFGSTSAQIIRRTQVPVIVVPHDPPTRVARIGVALEGADTPLAQIETLRALALAWGAECVVLHVADAPGEPSAPWEANAERFADELGQERVEVVRGLGDGDLSKALHALVQRAEVDMLCMLRGRHGRLEDLFARSLTLRESFASPVPLLILRADSSGPAD